MVLFITLRWWIIIRVPLQLFKGTIVGCIAKCYEVVTEIVLLLSDTSHTCVKTPGYLRFYLNLT